MMYTTAVVLFALWLFGEVCRYTMGGLIHILLPIATMMVLAKFTSDRKRVVWSKAQLRSRQIRDDFGETKTWHLK
jgi:hypothetical protein